MANASGTYGAQASGSSDGWGPARSVRPAADPSLRPIASIRSEGGPSGGRPAPRVVVPPPDTARREGPRAARANNHGLDSASSSRWDLPNSASAQRQGRDPQHAPAGAWQQLRETAAATPAPERGLPGWGALLVLLAISGAGALLDTVTNAHARGGFNIGIIIASIVGILIVRRSAMFPIVVAPPIVYSAVSGFLLYVRSNGLHDRKVLIDTASNWLVYGFPAIAAATAAVLIIAGIRIIIRR